MRDLGTLGGGLGFTMWMNSRGEVVGQSDLAGDQTAHPFLWNGHRMLDLGTLGGEFGVANWVSDAGTVVGTADVRGAAAHHAFLWRHGVMHDLPPARGAACSNAYAINNRGEAVGNATDCQSNSLAAMLWYRGAAIDLNTVIGRFPVHLTEAFYINERGQIACFGTLENGNRRVVLLTPRGFTAGQPRAVAGASPFATGRISVTRSTPDPRDGADSARRTLFRN
jgi:probable HAF family extracellular repeat protein